RRIIFCTSSSASGGNGVVILILASPPALSRGERAKGCSVNVVLESPCRIWCQRQGRHMRVKLFVTTLYLLLSKSISGIQFSCDDVQAAHGQDGVRDVGAFDHFRI